METGLGTVIHDGKGETALQSDFTAPKFRSYQAEISRLERLLRVRVRSNALRLNLGIGRGVFREQGNNDIGAILHLLHRPGEPFFDGAIDQTVGEQKQKNNRSQRKQQRSQHHAAAKLGAEYPRLALRVEPQESAQQDERERDE